VNHTLRSIDHFLRPALFWLAIAGSLFAAAPAHAQPVFSKAFAPATIGAGSTSRLTFSINNGDMVVPADDLAFTDVLPAGVTIAQPPSVINTCGGIVTAPGGGGTIELSGGSVGPGELCQIAVDVTSSTLATHTNTSGDLTSTAGNSGPASADLTVDSRPGFSKSFAAASIGLGDTLTLTFTIDNSNNASDAFSLQFTDTLPAGLEIEGPSNLTTDCPVNESGSLTATPGSQVVSYAQGNDIFSPGTPLPAGASCSISVDLTAIEPGSQVNRSGALNSSLGSSGFAVDALDVTVEPLTLVKSFINDPAAPGETVTLRFTVYNFTRDAASDIAFTDDLDATLSGLAATGLPLNDVCGSGSQVSGASTIGLTGGTLSGGESCTFDVALQVPAGAAPGTYPNVTSTVTGDVAGEPTAGSAAIDDLVISPAPILTKTVSPDPALAGDELTVEFLLENPSADPITDIAFQDVFTDFIPGSTITPPADGYCNGTGTTAVSTTTIQFSTIDLAAGASCTFSFTLQVPLGTDSGVYTNTTTEVTGLGGGEEPLTGRPASDDVRIVAAPRLDKAFVGDSVAPGDTVTLRFTLTRAEGAPGTATDIAFTDDLSAVLAGLSAIDTPITDVCGAGSEISGTTTLAFTGGSLPTNSSCSFDVTLQVPAGAIPGSYTNTTSTVTATVEDLAVEGPAASDDLEIAGLQAAKQFTDDPAVAGGTVTLEFVLSNGDPNFAATDIAFTDDLGAVLTGLAYNGAAVADPCGAGSQLSGTTTLSFTGGSLPAGGSCIFSVVLDVPAGASAGEFTNTTSQVTGTVDGSPVVVAPATDTLLIVDPLTIEKEFTDDPTVAGGTVTLQFTINNAHPTEPATDVAFTDDLDAALSGLQAVGTPIAACGGTLSGISLLTFSGGTVAAASFCTFSVTLQVPAAVPGGTTATNVTSSVTGTIDGVGVTGSPASDDLLVELAGFSKAFDGPTTATGTAVLTFTIENFSTDALTGLAFTDDLSATLAGLTAVGLPIDDVCGEGSTISGTSFLTFSGGSLAAEESCTFDVTVQVPADAAPGSYTNTTSNLSASGFVLAPPAVDDLTVVPPPAFSKVFDPAAIPQSGVTTLIFTLDNSASALPANDLAFTDDLPAGVVVAATPDATSTCTGGTLTAAPGTGSISYSGGGLAAGATCTVSVDVTSDTPGSYTNVSGALASSLGDSGTATAELVVTGGEFALSKVFTDPVLPGGTVELRFTLVTAATSGVTAVTFTDDLGAVLPGLTAVGLPADGFCGAGSQIIGTTILTVTGAEVPAGSDCTFTVLLDVPADAPLGTYTNTTSTVTGERLSDGLPTTADPATAPLEVVTLEFTKTLAPAIAAQESTVTATFMITNPDPANTVSALAFSDDLDAFVPGMTAANTPITDPCGTGSLVDGSATVTLSGGELAGGGSCTFDVTFSVPAGTSGDFTNTTSVLTGEVNGNAITVAAASDALTVAAPPVFSKAFTPDVIGSGDTSVLTLTINNNDQPLPADDLAFTDNLPAGLVLADPVNLANDCGGVVTAPAGGTSVSLAAGSVAAGATCSIAVGVTADSPGVYENITGELTSSLGTSEPASATLEVTGIPLVDKTFSPDEIPFGGSTTVIITIDNTANTLPADDLAFTDTLQFGLAVADPANASSTCSGGTLTAVPGATEFSYTGGSVAAGASCTVMVAVTGTTSGAVGNQVTVDSSLGQSSAASAVVQIGEVKDVPIVNFWGLLMLTMLLGLAAIWRLRA
jgi:uncharacterized repeat protein (TIGR01451 family)